MTATTTISAQNVDYHLHQNDCFVDASEVLLEEEDDDSYKDLPISGQAEAEEPEAGQIEPEATISNDEELGKNLGKTAHILRLALSNEFIRALSMCEQR